MGDNGKHSGESHTTLGLSESASVNVGECAIWYIGTDCILLHT